MGNVRLYHFLPAVHALDDIRKRRIKIAEIDQLNDPFELWCVAQDNRELRERLRDYKRTMDDRYGMPCFCRSWSNPLLWSHYAEKHRGNVTTPKPITIAPANPRNARSLNVNVRCRGLLFDLFIAQQHIRTATLVSQNACGELPDSALPQTLKSPPKFASEDVQLPGVIEDRIGGWRAMRGKISQK